MICQKDMIYFVHLVILFRASSIIFLTFLVVAKIWQLKDSYKLNIWEPLVGNVSLPLLIIFNSLNHKKNCILYRRPFKSHHGSHAKELVFNNEFDELLLGLGIRSVLQVMISKPHSHLIGIFTCHSTKKYMWLFYWGLKKSSY